MADSVDNRIVEMQFDNAAFQSKIQDTLASLDKLQKSLDASNMSKGLAGIDTSNAEASLTKMGSVVENVKAKFSTLDAVAFGAIATITSKAFDFLSGIGDKINAGLLDPLLSGGKNRAQNIEQAKFQFRGLGMDVTESMNSALDAVRGTAYGLDEAAKIAAQFGASGMKAGKDMTSALRAIAGAAAMSGSSFKEIGDIFAQSAAMGKVGNMDLQQFATRGLNAAAAVAKQLGVTEAQVHEMATKGTLDFQTFANAMDKAFGEHATQANETYAGSLANMHAALSRIGAAFFTPLMEKQRDLFNAMAPAIDKVKDALTPVIQAFTWWSTIKYNTIIDFINRLDFKPITESISKFVDAANFVIETLIGIVNAWRFAAHGLFDPNIAGNAVKLSDILVKLASALHKFVFDNAASIVRLFAGIQATFKTLWMIVSGVAHLFADLFQALMPDKAGTDSLKFFGELGFLIYKFNLFLQKSIIIPFFKLLEKGLVPVVKVLGDAIGVVIDFFVAFDYSKILNPVGDLLRVVGDAFVRFFGIVKDSKQLSAVIDFFGMLKDKIASFFSSLDFGGAVDALGGGISKLAGIIAGGGAIVGGFFASFKMGDILKEIGGLFSDLGSKIGGFFSFLAGSASAMDDFSKKLFDLRGKTKLIYSAVDATELAGNLNLQNDALQKSTSGWSGFIQTIKDYVDSFMQVIGTALGTLGQLSKKVADVIQSFFVGNELVNKKSGFQTVVDIINTILISGLLFSVKRFVDDFGGLVKAASGVFNNLGGVLKKFGEESNSTKLIKIAIALGILAASLTAIASIDKDKLASALAAMAVAFTQLFVMLKLMDKFINNSASIAKSATLLIAIGISMKFLSEAVATMATLSWDQLAHGLAGTAIGLVALGTAIKLMGDGVSPGTALTILGMAAAMFIISKAVEAFAKYSWGDLAKGLVAMAVAMAAIGSAVGEMGPASILAAPAILIVSFALLKIAEAVQAFADIKAKSLVKGLMGLAFALNIIAVSIGELPPSFFLVGLVMPRVAASLVVLADAVSKMGSLNLVTLLKGLYGLGIALTQVVVAALLMQDALPGAVAMVIVAGALAILTKVVEELGGLDLKTLVVGLGAMVAVFLVLGAAGYFLSPALIALGVAMTLLGSGFALLGVGAYLLAKAFALLVDTAKTHIDDLIGVIDKMVGAIPHFVATFVKGIANASQDIVNSFDIIMTSVEKMIGRMALMVIKVMPQIQMAVNAIITTIIELIGARIVDIIDLGFQILLALGQGIMNNIGALTVQAIEILARFAQALSDNMPSLVDSGVKIIVAFLEGIGSRIGDIIQAGTDLLVNFLLGIANSLVQISGTVTAILAEFVVQVADNIQLIIDVGAYVLTKFLEGLSQDIQAVLDAGANFIIKVMEGVESNIEQVIQKGVDVVLKFIEGLGKNALELANGAAKLLEDFLNALADAIRTHSKEIDAAGLNLAQAIIDGLTGGLLSEKNVGKVVDAAKGLAGKVVDGFKSVIPWASPSPLFIAVGGYIGQGLAIGLDKDKTAENSAVKHAERIVAAFSETLSKIPDSLDGMDQFSPTITPVLDLTKVQAGAKGLNGMLAATISPSASIAQARLIATTATTTQAAETPTPGGVTEVTFIQNNNSPKALSANDIYRNTKSQIALAKEELGI